MATAVETFFPLKLFELLSAEVRKAGYDPNLYACKVEGQGNTWTATCVPIDLQVRGGDVIVTIDKKTLKVREVALGQ